MVQAALAGRQEMAAWSGLEPALAYAFVPVIDGVNLRLVQGQQVIFAAGVADRFKIGARSCRTAELSGNEHTDCCR